MAADRPALEWIRGVPRRDINDEILGLGALLIREKVMPGPLAGDALHLALACWHGLDYVLSWNVRHLANPNKLTHLRNVCLRLALTPPAILTPDLLFEVDDGTTA